MNALDKVIMTVAPVWGLKRVRARSKADEYDQADRVRGNYNAAKVGRRTEHWSSSNADANTVSRMALPKLRALSRDLARNNGWVEGALETIENDVVGWGIIPSPDEPRDSVSEQARALWKAWGETSQCDFEGRLNFYGIQQLLVRSMIESGEVLIRFRPRPSHEGLAIPLQLQVLESDFLDHTKDGVKGESGPIYQGIEFDAAGRRAAYWLYEEHPGASTSFPTRRTYVSHRVPADQIVHLYRVKRPGQFRGIPWFAPAIVNLEDFDEYEDATLQRAKVAACFAGFYEDIDASFAGEMVGEQSEADPLAETVEPGRLQGVPTGKKITFSNPPAINDDGFTQKNLRRIAKTVGLTYERFANDFSQVNFSSARMGEQGYWRNVHKWRWQLVIPHACEPVWNRAMEAAERAGKIEVAPKSKWTAQAMPTIDPVKEVLATRSEVRSGLKTPSEAVREQGLDPETHFREWAKDAKRFDDLGLVFDIDPRKTSGAGLTQARPDGTVLPPTSMDEGDKSAADTSADDADAEGSLVNRALVRLSEKILDENAVE